jgi:hypothetical protein
MDLDNLEIKCCDPDLSYEPELEEIGEQAQIMTVKEFLSDVEAGGYIDDDGFGYPAVDGVVDKSTTITPSARGRDIPEGTTHVFWYNR